MTIRSHKVFCLLSGGIDSSTTLAMARSDFPNSLLEAVSVDYGQRHFREIECAAYQAANQGAEHHTISMHGLMEGMLTDPLQALPDVSYADLAPGISPTYVSFRNGLMLSMLASRAQAWVMNQEKLFGGEASADLYIGVHADDGVNWAYPDCTNEFIGPMAAAIYVGTYHKVRLRSPLVFMTKVEVVQNGHALDVDYAHTWSCYAGGEEHCGVCPTCRSRKEAFQLAGLEDPTVYAA